MKLSGFQGVVFDLDGTLLDTLQDIANAANAVLAQHGFPPHPPLTYRAFVGEGVRMLLNRALPPTRRDEGTLAACLQTMAIAYPANLNKTAQPYPGIPELLSDLRARGLRLAVLSNKPDEFTARCIADFFPDGLFHPILGLHPERPRKPDPTGAFQIAASWGIPPSQILYLGDSATDMETACRAGMTAVGVLWGYRDREELLRAGAIELLKAPLDLLAD